MATVSDQVKYNLIATVSKFISDLSRAEKAVDRLDKKLLGLSKSYDILGRSAITTLADISMLTRQVDILNSSMRVSSQLSREFKSMGSSIARSQAISSRTYRSQLTSVPMFSGSDSETVKQMTTISKTAHEAGTQVESLYGRLSKFQNLISHARGRSTAGWGLTMVAAGLYPMAIAPLVNFEHNMAFLQGLEGWSDKSELYNITRGGVQTTAMINAVQALRQEAMYIGANTIKTTGEAAEGLLQMSKLGMNLRQLANLGMPVTQLAIAGDMTVSDAGRLTTMAINQFGLKSDTASVVTMMNQMLKAASISQLDVKDLIQILGRAGATAANTGMSFTEFLAIASVIKDKLGGLSMTSTGMRSATMDLLAPTRRAMTTYQKLGITNVEAEYTKLGLIGFLKEIHARIAAGHFSAYQRLNIENNLFGKQQAAAGNAELTDLGKVDRNLIQIKNSKGMLNFVNDTLNKSLYGSYYLMLSRMENFILNLGSPANGPMAGGGLTSKLSSILQNIAQIFTYLTALPAPVKELIVDLGIALGAFTALGLATKVWGFTLGGIEAGIGLLKGMINVFVFMGDAIYGVVAAIRAMTTAEFFAADGFKAIRTAAIFAWEAILGPIGIMLAALSAAITLFLNYTTVGKSIKEKVGGWLKNGEDFLFPNLDKQYEQYNNAKLISAAKVLGAGDKTNIPAFAGQIQQQLEKIPKPVQYLAYNEQRLGLRSNAEFFRKASVFIELKGAVEANTAAVKENTGSKKKPPTTGNKASDHKVRAWNDWGGTLMDQTGATEAKGIIAKTQTFIQGIHNFYGGNGLAGNKR